MAYHLGSIKKKLEELISRGEELLTENRPADEDVDFEAATIDDYLFELEDLTAYDGLNMMTETPNVDKEANEVIELMEKARELVTKLDSLREE